MSNSTSTARVKERDEVDRCRHCGRPTWSFRRCCVPCKRAGRGGPGTIPSLYSQRSTACRVLAFGCFWAAHMVAAVLLAAMLVIGMGRPIHTGDVREFFLLGLLESTLDGIGFSVAITLSPRPAAALRPRYCLLAAYTGVVCTILTTAAVIGIGRAGSVPPELLLAVPVVLTAVAARVCLSASFAARLLESGADRTPCTACGTEPCGPDELFCRECGEPRTNT
jgi:hypothetical protein